MNTKNTARTSRRQPRLTEMFETHIAELEAVRERIETMLDATAEQMGWSQSCKTSCLDSHTQLRSNGV